MPPDSPVSARHGIVVGVDGSPASRVAADWAARDAASRHLPLTLVHVQPPADARMWIDVPIPAGGRKRGESCAREVLADAAQLAAAAATDLTVDVLSLAGNPVAALAELSDSATMVVVGRRGLGAVGRRLLGSVSSGVMRHAHCPVAIVHDEDPLMANPASAPVVVGVDGSPLSELATGIAFEEAARRGVTLVALHAWSDFGVYGIAEADWSDLRLLAEDELGRRLEAWTQRYPQVAVRRVVTHERPSRALVREAESAQLLVVGSRGRGGFAGLLLGSVSAAVAESARMPVIVARTA